MSDLIWFDIIKTDEIEKRMNLRSFFEDYGQFFFRLLVLLGRNGLQR